MNPLNEEEAGRFLASTPRFGVDPPSDLKSMFLFLSTLRCGSPRSYHSPRFGVVPPHIDQQCICFTPRSGAVPPLCCFGRRLLSHTSVWITPVGPSETPSTSRAPVRIHPSKHWISALTPPRYGADPPREGHEPVPPSRVSMRIPPSSSCPSPVALPHLGVDNPLFLRTPLCKSPAPRRGSPSRQCILVLHLPRFGADSPLLPILKLIPHPRFDADPPNQT